MKVSVCLTVHNRTPEVSKLVADSFRLPGNTPDELILVLDRPTQEAKEGALAAYEPLPFTVRTVTIPGMPEWICPARAWNFAYRLASGDILYCISSEVVQEPGNVDKAMAMSDGKTVIFGACRNSVPAQLVTGAKPGVLASSEMPRPLGFIAAIPAENVKQIGGADEGFMNGLWYEDDDFFLRLWHTGLDFLFTDDISGTHLHHDRPVLETSQGMAGINRNLEYMRQKHGVLHPWEELPKLVEKRTGMTTWRHL